MTTATTAYHLVRGRSNQLVADEAPSVLWGNGTPNGDVDPFVVANKGSLYLQTDATDDTACLWIKVDEGEDDNDWVQVFSSGADSPLAIGAFSSTAVGNGIALSTSTTATFRVYSDDGGTAMSAAGSVPDLRGTLSRVLVTTDNSANHMRLFALMGHLKSYDGEWKSEQIGGVHGYLELVRNTGTINFQGYGVTAGVQATVETSGTMTLDANHVLAGVAAISKMTSGLTQTGVTAAFYADVFDTTNWSDATARSIWKWGMYLPSGASTNGVYANCATLGATGRVLQLYGTMANGALTDGYGAAEIDLTLSGTNTDHIAAFSSWVNIPTGTAAAGTYIAAMNVGVYEASAATITNAKVVFGARMQKILGDTDALSFPFSVNTNNTAITALIDVPNFTDLGLVTNAGSDAGTLIPIARDANGTLKYVKVYDAA